MNILVCIKPVPDPDKYNLLELDPVTGTLKREGIPTVINPADKNALEEAIKIRAARGGRITVLSMAPEFSKDKIMESLAMGADEAFLVSDRVLGGADTYATSYVLAEAVKKVVAQRAVANDSMPGVKSDEDKGSHYFDLILTGNESADGATAHVPAQLAEWLGLPHICNVDQIEISEIPDKAEDAATAEGDKTCDSVIKIRKKTEAGREIFEGRLPALIAVSRDINKPRLINAMGIIKAKKKPLNILNNSDLVLDESRIGLKGSPTQTGELITPDLSRHAEDLGSEADIAAEKILGILKKAGA